MNKIARELGVTCSADIGLVSIEYTCLEGGESYSQVLTLTGTGVNKMCIRDSLRSMEMDLQRQSRIFLQPVKQLVESMEETD